MDRYTWLIFIFFVEMGSCYVAQGNLKLLGSSDSPTLASQSAGMTGVSHHAWLGAGLLKVYISPNRPSNSPFSVYSILSSDKCPQQFLPPDNHICFEKKQLGFMNFILICFLFPFLREVDLPTINLLQYLKILSGHG